MSECNSCNELKNEIAGYQQVMKLSQEELKQNKEVIVFLQKEIEVLKGFVKDYKQKVNALLSSKSR